MNAKLSNNLNKQYIDIKEKVAQVFQGRKSESVNGLPPGQRLVQKMIAMPPIVSEYPHIDVSDYKLRVYGEVEYPLEFDFAELSAMGVKDRVVDFHCVTRWSKLNQDFSGVDFGLVVNKVKPKPAASFVVFEGIEGYTTNVSLSELIKFDAFIATKMDSKDIPDEYGGPVRMVVPNLYGWKSAKHLVGIRFVAGDEPGFWEVRGYHNHGDPWNEERYS